MASVVQSLILSSSLTIGPVLTRARLDACPNFQVQPKSSRDKELLALQQPQWRRIETWWSSLSTQQRLNSLAVHMKVVAVHVEDAAGQLTTQSAEFQRASLANAEGAGSLTPAPYVLCCCTHSYNLICKSMLPVVACNVVMYQL